MRNLKVLHILSSPSAGGAEVFVKDMVLNSRAKGIDAGVLFISSAENIGRSSSYQREFLSALTKEKIPFFILPKNARRNIFQGYSTFREFIKLFSPDCIHTHLLMGIVYSIFFCRQIPLVYTHHNSVIQTSTFIFKALMKCCDQHIGISQICAQFLERYLPQRKQCKVIYNAVDSNRLSSLEKIHNNTKNKLSLIAVGAISPQKNYQYMLEVMAEVKKVLPNKFTLKIAGEGSLHDKNKLLDFIKANDLTDTVELLGNRADIANLLAQSDVFLMTSSWEGLPIALLEAQISGLPSLVTDVGGCKELIDITNGGIVVQSNDIKKYTVELIELICNYPLRERLSMSALKKAHYFSINYCLQEHKKVYKEQVDI